jgi:hypothetical protein
LKNKPINDKIYTMSQNAVLGGRNAAVIYALAFLLQSTLSRPEYAFRRKKIIFVPKG